MKQPCKYDQTSTGNQITPKPEYLQTFAKMTCIMSQRNSRRLIFPLSYLNWINGDQFLKNSNSMYIFIEMPSLGYDLI